MARRKRVYRKIERRDPRYDSTLVGKLISKVMLDGKRSLAERIVYAAIDMANEGTDSIDPLEVITRAIENAKPRVEVKSRRVGGATYQVPLEVDPARSESLAMRWIVGRKMSWPARTITSCKAIGGWTFIVMAIIRRQQSVICVEKDSCRRSRLRTEFC